MTNQEKEQKYLSGAYGGVARTAFLAGRRSANALLQELLDNCGCIEDTGPCANCERIEAFLEPKEMTPNA